VLTLKNAKIFNGKKFIEGEKNLVEVQAKEEKEMNLDGMWILPGLIDTHAHLRDPGQLWREDVYSGTRAAAHGGITTVFAMPNTTPAIDTEQAVLYLKERAKEASAQVKIVGAITKGREGKELSEMGRMARAGVVGFSDDGAFLDNSSLARHAMEYAAELGLPIISHCEEQYLKGGHMREGWYSTLYGVYPTSFAAESIAVAREIELSYLTKAHVHIAHISTKRSVELVRHAKADGINVTCDVCVHHLLFTDKDIEDFDTSKKINPPFPTKEDQEELYRGLEDGTIDAIITDHAPYAVHEKEVEFQAAPFGIIGFETLLNELIMVSKRGIKIEKLLSMVTSKAAELYGIEGGKIDDDHPTDFMIFDPNDEWIPTPQTLLSKAQNTPFLNKRLKGRVLATFHNGKKTYGDTKWKLM
jgi:dihydroorotase